MAKKHKKTAPEVEAPAQQQPDGFRELDHAAWTAEAKARFGDDAMKWAFICPVCKYVQTVQKYKDSGAPQTTVAFSCVGRYIKGSKDAFSDKGEGPCTYAGGGLIGLNPVLVKFPDGGTTRYFEFAPAPAAVPAAPPPAAEPPPPAQAPSSGEPPCPTT